MRHRVFVRSVLLTLGIFLAAFQPPSARAALQYDPALDWHTIETPHFEFHFHTGVESVAQRLASQAEPIHERISEYFSWVPRAKTQVVIADQWDYMNGEATPAPYNNILIHVTPSTDVDGLEDYDDTLARVFQHEYVHIVHLDKAVGFPENLRDIVGRLHPWLFPNEFEPTWIIEGIATYLETDKTRGVGRGQSNYYRALMRNEVAHGLKSLDQLNQPLVSWPGGTARYLYGVYFFNFLHDRYGDEYIQNFARQYSENFIPFFLNSTAKRTFGKKTFYNLWDEFQVYLHSQFDPEIADVAKRKTLEGTALTATGNRTGRSRIDSAGNIYYLRADGELPRALMRTDSLNRKQELVTRAYGGGPFDLHASQGILLVQTDIYANTKDFSDLYRVDPETGDATQLTRRGRYTSAAWSPDGTQIAAVKTQAGKNQLVLLDASGKELESLWQDESVQIGNIDWAPASPTLVAPLRRLGQWNLELFDLTTRQWLALTTGNSVRSQPQWSADGKSIVYVSDEDGIYNVYQLDPDTRATKRLTNVITGAFYPSLSADGLALYYTGLNAKGFDLYKLALTPAEPALGAEPPPVDNAATLSETPAFPVREVGSSARSYGAIAHMSPTWWWPSLANTSQETLFAVTTGGNDPLRWHSYFVTLGADTKNKTEFWNVNYTYDRLFPTLTLLLSRDNGYGFYNDGVTLAETVTSDQVTAVAEFPWMQKDSQSNVFAGYRLEYERQTYRHVGVPAVPSFDDRRLIGGARYSSAQLLPRAVARQEGWSGQIGYDTDIGPSYYPGTAVAVQATYYSPVFSHSTIDVSGLAARSGPETEPYRVGDSATTNDATLAGRRSFRLRGYPLGLAALRGNNLEFGNVTWHMPLGWYETGIMAPPIGITRARANLYAEGARIWSSSPVTSSNTLYRTIGTEIVADFTIGYRFPLNFTAGIAQGLDAHGERKAYMSTSLGF